MRVIIGNLGAIYRRELMGYFVSPFAYLVASIFWLLSGLFFVLILQGTIEQSQAWDMQAAQMGQMGLQAPSVDAAYEFLKSFLGGMGYLSLFILPILSMGLYAEERKRGTLELLATSPITNWAVAVGKLLGVVTFFSAMVMPLLGCSAIVFASVNPPIPPSVPLLGHAGLILLAASVLSVGMFISSLTESTILAAILTFALIIFLSVIEIIGNWLAQQLGTQWQLVGEAVGNLSLLKHYYNLVTGVFDSSSIVIFASYITFGIFLTAASIELVRFGRS